MPERTRCRDGGLFILTAAALACAVAPAHAESTGGGGGTLRISFENDQFSSSDGYYTNGTRLSWIAGPGAADGWAGAVAHGLLGLPPTADVRATYALGQNIYTPLDIGIADPPPGSRPYGGWLYGAIGLVAESGARADELELELGVVGPAALAGPTQKLAHDITGAQHPEGWDTQLDNEPGVVLAYRRSWRLPLTDPAAGPGLDATPHLGAALGNVITYAGAGLTLRLGEGLARDRGPARLLPDNPGSGFPVAGDGFAWYLFAGVEGRAVAHNIFLDGNTFSDSRSVDREPLVGDVRLGFAVIWRGARLSYTHVLRSDEFESQTGSDDFGSISLGVRF